MPKRKSNPTNINELEKELSEVAEDITEIVKNVVEPAEIAQPKIEKNEEETEDKRVVLLRLAEDGDINRSVASVKKANRTTIEKLYTEYERRRSQKANEFLTDFFISKFASVLGGLDAVSSPDDLIKELKSDELLRRDVYSAVESISPYIPMLGLVSGGITTAKHIAEHKFHTKDNSKKNHSDVIPPNLNTEVDEH